MDATLEYPIYKDIIAFINLKSGGANNARKLYENLKLFLSEDRVLNLSETNPKER